MCILFGDGVGVFFVEYDKEEMSFIVSNVGLDGLKGYNLYCIELFEEMFLDDLENYGYIV